MEYLSDPVTLVGVCVAGYAVYATLTSCNQPKKAPEAPKKKIDLNNLKEYTPSDVAKHDSEDDCWLIVGTKVYDVTQFVNDHPGGLESIVRRSGVNRDATVGFQGGQHPDTVEDQIRQYLCGKLKEYSRAEIAKHNKKDDCWLIIDDKVYDVTKFIADHPGGEIILKNAGADSSEGFHRVEAHTRIGKEDNTYSGAQVKMGALLIGALKTEERKAKKQ